MEHLLKAVGHIQFQGEMQQRMEHVPQAMIAMRNHLLRLTVWALLGRIRGGSVFLHY
jgi:hypothetical protein